jgi:hypothetical protein
LSAGFLGQEDADRIGNLAVGGDIEDELGGWRFGIVGDGVAFPYEVVLVNVSLGPGVGFETANGHRDIIR